VTPQTVFAPVMKFGSTLAALPSMLARPIVLPLPH
jgi:hypothetical protein